LGEKGVVLGVGFADELLLGIKGGRQMVVVESFSSFEAGRSLPATRFMAVW
jgi:hypothetical protein